MGKGKPPHFGGKGYCHGKRHRPIVNAIDRISKPAFRRMLRRGGVKRIGSCVYAIGRTELSEYVEKIVKTAIIYTKHARRKTVTAMDIVHALKNHNRSLYGYNS